LKNNTQTFLNNFPSPRGEEPRPQQIKSLTAIQNSFDAGKKFVIARLPTGSGKSHIATAIARSSRDVDRERERLIENYEIFQKDKYGQWIHEDFFNERDSFGAFILTVTRSLQNQYLDLFPGQLSAMGQNNYHCDIDKNVTIDFAPCIFAPKLKLDCFKKDRCSFYKSRKSALSSKDPVLNYRVFFNLPKFLRRREFLICDEAKEIEEELVSQYSVTINYAQLLSEGIKFNKIISDDSQEAFHWLQAVFLQVTEQVKDLRHKIALMSKNATLEGIVFKTAQRFNKLNNLYNSMWDMVDRWQDCQYMIESKDNKNVTFVPFNIKPMAREIFDSGDKVLLTSATISDPEEYARSLGINKDEYDVIDIPSSFEAEKSPIICSPKYSLSFKTLESNLPKVLDMALKICEQHKGQKGLIHTHTNTITEAIKKKTGKNSRFLFRESGQSNEIIIAEHQRREDDDTILVSPSLDTGISLDGDLGRFQIIIKAPYLPLGSKRIKRIFEKNQRYYTMMMLDSLIQMSGRCTRSEGDHSVTYILDGAAVKAIISNKKYLPKYFLDRFV
jgi:Rad3-related DNA helicase